MTLGKWVAGFTVASVISLPLIKGTLYQGYKTKSSPKKQKTVVVTGATGNLGACISATLAHYNQRVIMACRDMEKCRSLRREIVYRTENKSVVCRHLDLSSIESINKFADEIIKSEPKIDVIVNNAAIKNAPERTLTKEGTEMTYFVNYIGPFLLTLRLYDKLVESSKSSLDSRIINIIGKPKSSWNIDMNDINFDKRKYKPTQAYHQSKLALAYFTQLMDELAKKNSDRVYVFGINPGLKNVASSFIRSVDIKSQATIILHTYTRANPDYVIGSTVKCCLDPELANRKSSGLLYGLFSQGWSWKKPANNMTVAKALWNQTASLLLEELKLPLKPSDEAKDPEEKKEY